MEFISPTKGKMSFDEVFEDILTFVSEHPEDQYSLIIGSDSQLRDKTCFVTALIVHRASKGGRFYYTKNRQKFTRSLRQRIFYETSNSLVLASQLTAKLAETHHELNVEIHLDVGTNGKTKELIKEVVGMVTGSGFCAKIKPDSYGASSIADRFTK